MTQSTAPSDAAARRLSSVGAAYEMIRVYARERPLETIVVLVALFVSSVIESVSMVSILPLISIAQGEQGEASGASAKLMQYLTMLGVPPTLLGMMIFVVVAMVVKSAIRLAADLYLAFSVSELVSDMRLRLLRALGNAKWDYLIDQSSGRISSLFSTEAHRAAYGMNQSVQMLSTLMQALLTVSAAMMVSWQFTLVTLVACLLIALPLNYLVGLSRRTGRILTNSMAALLHNVVEGLQGFKALKAMAREQTLVLVLEADVSTYRRNSLINSASSVALVHLPEVGAVIVFCAAVYWFLSSGSVPLSEIAVIAALGYRGVNRINDLQRVLQKAVTMYQGFALIKATTDEAEQAAEPASGSALPSFETAIELTDVHFSFGAKEVISGVSLDIPARGVTALVGPSGAGKSTFVDLILGLRHPARGDIRIDGVSMRELDLRRWRGLIGYVPQETHLFNKSIYENVALGERSISRDDVMRALADAGAAEWIESLPEGIDTHAGSSGLRFSGGQRQRISLARALVHKPKLLLLDEATSALDPETELLICKTLEQLGRSIAILAVSHQPGILTIANRVYRIDRGRVNLVEPSKACSVA